MGGAIGAAIISLGGWGSFPRTKPQPASRQGCGVGRAEGIAGEAELGQVAPHPVQDHAHASGQRDQGSRLAPPLRDLDPPGLEPGRVAALHRHRRGLAQGGAHGPVAGPSDLPDDIPLAGLVA